MSIKGAITKKISIKPGVKLFIGILPFLVFYFLLCYLPLEGWRYSFYNYKPGYALKDCEFVGFKHFLNMFLNPVMLRETLRVLRNTIVISLLSISTSFLPMLFAIFLNELPGKRFKKIVQTATTLPNFISWVVVFSLVNGLLASESGLVNILLKEMGLIEKGINFLANEDFVWLSMWLFTTWKGLGWSAVVYISGLSSIDQELYEAAAVDGAKRFQKIWYITIPGLMPIFITLLILGIGNFLNSGMDQYYVFQNAFNKDKIEVLDLYVYNLGIGSNNISYSTAIGMLKSLVAILLLAVANGISGKVREEKIF